MVISHHSPIEFGLLVLASDDAPQKTFEYFSDPDFNCPLNNKQTNLDYSCVASEGWSLRKVLSYQKTTDDVGAFRDFVLQLGIEPGSAIPHCQLWNACCYH